MTVSPDPTTNPLGSLDNQAGGLDQILQHVAIIMDGNGRWAKGRGLSRMQGHRRGVDVIHQIVRRAVYHRIKYLTLYSFSTENWRRPSDEVSYLMELLKLFIRRELTEFHALNVRVRIIGDRLDLPADIFGLLQDADLLTAQNTGLTLVVAFNYGARQEIVQATRLIASEVAAGRMRADQIDDALFERYLYTGDIPDPDLIIRTSGEQRLSNFLLWQAAYSELVFVPTLWPDFDDAAFDMALSQFQARERRFGGLAKEPVAK